MASPADNDVLHRWYEHWSSPDYEKPPSSARALQIVAHAASDPQLCWIAAEIEKRDRAVVIDLGCGVGRLLATIRSSLLSRDAPLSEYVGLDADPTILTYAQENARSLGIAKYCCFAELRRDRLPVAEISAECAVVANDVVHHLRHEQLARFLYSFIHDLPSTAIMIIAEPALPKRAERKRVFLSSADWRHLGQLLSIDAHDFPARSVKGLDLTRVVLSREPDCPSSSVGAVDKALRQMLDEKLRHLDMSLELLDPSSEGHLTRLGMLEQKKSIEYQLARWTDDGSFVAVSAFDEPPVVSRERATQEIQSECGPGRIAVLLGEFGIGKTTVLRSLLMDFPDLILAATACVSSAEDTFVAWLQSEAHARSLALLSDACREFVRAARPQLASILRTLAEANITLAIDNAHLCDTIFLDRLAVGAVESQCPLLLVSSVPLSLPTRAIVSELEGFTFEEASTFLRRNSVESIDKKRILDVWKNAGGNPQRMLMSLSRHGDIPASFGRLGEVERATIGALLVDEKGLPRGLLSRIVEVTDDELRHLVRRGLVQDSGEYCSLHDTVRIIASNSPDIAIRCERIRTRLCNMLLGERDSDSFRSKRMPRNRWGDDMRLCAWLCAADRSQEAWDVLESISYAVYMDGEYDALLRTLQRIRDVTPKGMQLRMEREHFWLLLREARICKMRAQCERARECLAHLATFASEREQLAVVKEQAEVEREADNTEEALHLYRRAWRLDKEWARDRRDRLITLKQIGITYEKLGKLNSARLCVKMSLEGREGQDRHGMASCKKALARIGFSQVKRQKEMHASDLMDPWNNAWEAVVEFSDIEDYQGVSGTVELLVEMGHWAIRGNALSDWRVPLQKLVNQHWGQCSLDYTTRMKNKLIECGVTVPNER